MTDKDFKIGDSVIFNGFSDNNIKKGAICEIVADKVTPYKMANPLSLSPIFPNTGHDFVINEFTTQEEIDNKVFKPFVSVLQTEISHHKPS